MSLNDFGWKAFFSTQLDLDEIETTKPARVIEIHRTGLRLNDGERVFDLALGGAWYRGEAEDLPTVGDWILTDDQQHKAQRLLQRSSLIKRVAPHTGEIQLIAANVDTLFVVTSCNDEFNASRLERYLALALESEVQPVVALTKADLAEDADTFADLVRQVSSTVPVEVVNSLDPDTLGGLSAWCAPGQTVALVGSSGVGKSTLVNSLSGSELQVTGDIREHDAHGRHTTTHRSLHRLDSGALLLDVPGLRELGLADTADGISDLFEDIEALALRCKFSDCAHDTEPGCAIQAAVDSGELDERRLRNFEKLQREEAFNTSTLAQRRQQYKAFGRMARNSTKNKALMRGDNEG